MDCPLYIYNYSKMHTVEYPASRGPLCFTCEEVTDPTLCHRVVVCAPDQVSSIILISENLAGSIHDATIIATYAIFFSFLQVCHIQENIEFGDIFYTTSCINKHVSYIPLSVRCFCVHIVLIYTKFPHSNICLTLC